MDTETRKILGPDKEGEICVKGPVLFNGYIGKPLVDDLDDDGFFKTGDIGYYDEEGYFFIVDRLKELIKYKAWQVNNLLERSKVKNYLIFLKLYRNLLQSFLLKF